MLAGKRQGIMINNEEKEKLDEFYTSFINKFYKIFNNL
jgi:hypothetical protein